MGIMPKALFAYATDFAAKAQREGKNRIYPTFREVAKRFNATHDDIEAACNDWDQSDGYMQPAVGVRSGAGVAAYKLRGDYLVEAYS